jgi:hypothetical protein
MVPPIKTLLSMLIVALKISRAFKLVGITLIFIGSLTFMDLLVIPKRSIILKMFPILGSSL